MEKTKYVLALFAILMMAMPAMAYTIDGNTGDWCLDLTNNWAVEDTWVPCSSVYYVVEDNIDSDKMSYASPAYATGVHIQGPPKADYDEPLLYFVPAGVWMAQPYGGEIWDIEAVYLDSSDPSYVYVSVVTSTPPGWGAIGDLGIDMDEDGVYEYGVKINGVAGGVHTLELYGGLVAGDWSPCTEFPVIPATFNGGTKISDVEGAFVNLGISDHSVDNYFIEIKIPKSDLGGSPLMRNLHLTPLCGNDPIPAPEFVIAILMISLISPAFIYLTYKKRH